MKILTLVAVAALLPLLVAETPPDDVDEALKSVALDYIEGWYTADGDRMASALHPKLAKRMTYIDADGNSQLNEQDADFLVGNTRRGGGSDTPVDERRQEVTILDRYGDAAVVKVVATGWIDYLQVIRFDGRWVIVNVLWELDPEAKAQVRIGD